MGSPLVAFRGGDGRASVLVDRCPHRNAPLSAGRVRAGELECGYHGWRFDGDGRCVAVPGLARPGAGRRGVGHHATCEQDGIVWFWSEPDAAPTGEPFRLPDLGTRARQVVLTHDIRATMHATIENTLDVPHTAFVHRGLLRGGRPNEITARRRPIPGGIEVEYRGEPYGLGFLRARRGPSLEHHDRFVLPCVAQVEYRAGPWLHIVNTVLHLPMAPALTRTWFVLRATSAKLPDRLVAAVVRAQGPRVARQDVRVLERQQATIERFGDEQFSSTDLDLFGTPVRRLLRAAADGAAGEDLPAIPAKEVVVRV
jgi:phenylpropionate dioxygenase-like ring-hydroxylating dioxygenase large terminal subunit